MRSVHCFLIALSAALAACGAAEGVPGVDPGSQSPSATATPLIDEPVAPLCPQGLGTRYMARQGRSLLGSRAQSFTVREVRIGCNPVADLKLDGTTLRGTVNGKAVSGQDFVGATVVQSDETGASAEARIDAIDADAQDTSGETLLYTLSYKDAATGASVGACVPDKTGTAKAIPVLGAWDASGAHILSPTEFTFGCTSGVVAKCVRWGYKPWQSKGNTPLGPYHEACVRMARADYCGDGTSFTRDDTPVDIYDNIGLLERTPSLMLFDAAWTPSGAYCIGKERWLNLLGILSPTCIAKFFALSLLEQSPVYSGDLCLFKRRDIESANVLIDNRSGLNIQIF